jgi:hypothetical protein
MTVRMYVRHHVTDFAAWRKVYDAFDAKRREMGVTGQVFIGPSTTGTT